MFNQQIIRWQHFFYFILLIFFAATLAKPINLTRQDLGRHIANGRELTAGNAKILTQNYYSYTYPEKEFINHHWLFGLIVFAIGEAAGFAGIHLFHILILIIAFYFFLKNIYSATNHTFTLLFGLAAALFLSLRIEVRPESIGLLFITHLLWQLKKIIDTRRITQQQIFILLSQQLVWINIHISFIFAIFLIVLLLGCSYFLQSPNLDKKINKKLLMLCSGLMLISLLNPNLHKGLLQPLLIFTDYGYPIVENQNLLFLWRVINHALIFPYLLLLLIGSGLLWVKGKILSWYEILLCFTGYLLGFFALRNITIFIVFTFPILAKLSYAAIKTSSLSKLELKQSHKLILIGQLYLFIIALALSTKIVTHTALAQRKIGLLPHQTQAAEFIEANKLKGPIFNNYDIGSYLIYYHPELKVFTDNRPEAYGKEFFQNIYLPMQTDPKIWQEELQQHQFQTVIFSNQDLTPWGINFMSYLNNDPDWQKIFHDKFITIWNKME